MDKANDPRTDEELMRLYQAGDYVAFETLYHRHSGRVYEFLRKKVSPEIARDLLQETFLKLHRSRSQYSSQYPFLPWLFTISRNVFVDFVRLSETKISERSSEGPLSELPAETTPENSWSGELATALEHLPENQKHAIKLRYLSDWSFEKIAADLKTSPLNARKIISRGIKKLRSNFEGGAK